MTPTASPHVFPGLAEAVRAKLTSATSPLKLAEVIKGLPKQKKATKEEVEIAVRGVLDEEVRHGRLFVYPSGKDNEPRYWRSDEKHFLQEKALELAATPLAISTLRTKLNKELKGLDGAFVEKVVRELVSEDRLFEHPAKTKKGGPLFGASPPPPALEQDKHKKVLTKLVAECEKLLNAAGVTTEDLFRVLRTRLPGRNPEKPGTAIPASLTNPTELHHGERAYERPAVDGGTASVETLILGAVAHSEMLSLADLRRKMPPSFQGQDFDDAVLRLADTNQVFITQDEDPIRFTPTQRAEYVQDGEVVFTTITKRNHS
jgi:hypothetical protein